MVDSSGRPVQLASLRQWLWRNRNSPRAAFVLRLVSLAFTSLLSLCWARLLVETLGQAVYGIFLAFNRVVQLGGVSDFGITAAVGVRALNHLSRNEEEAGRRLLANARGLYVGLALVAVVGFIVLSPWLPGWFGFTPVPDAGSLQVLFAFGGLGVGILLISGYFQTLNYVHGNVTWPIIPAFILGQFSFVSQYILARMGSPLWIQYVATLIALAAGIGCAVWMLKISHPWLGNLWPLRMERNEVRPLLTTSFYAYLYTLGNLVYLATDDLVVNASFTSAAVPAYRFNYRLCELSVTLLGTASFVSMPNILRRLLSPSPVEHAFGLDGFQRLQKLQGFAACVAAILYLAFNDLFIRIWQGPAFQMPLDLQTAFALNMAVTIAGDAAVQSRGRMTTDGMRVAGIVIGMTALINAGLSVWAAKIKFMTGIAGATVIAQSTTSFFLGRSICGILHLPWRLWLIRTWLIPMTAVSAFALCRSWIAPDTLLHCLCLLAIALAFAGALAAVFGIRWEFVADEWKRLRAAIR